MIPELHSAQHVADLLHVDREWLLRFVRSHDLEHVRGSRGTMWFTDPQAEAVVDAMTHKPAARPKPTIAQSGRRRSA